MYCRRFSFLVDFLCSVRSSVVDMERKVGWWRLVWAGAKAWVVERAVRARMDDVENFIVDCVG